jgi:Domain of unknown function (DUF4388)
MPGSTIMLSGYLSDYSLAEILRFIHQGHKTGRLTVQDILPEIDKQNDPHYIWFKNGQVVAHARDLDCVGLIAMLEKRNWISSELSIKLRSQCKKLTKPLGLQLQKIHILDIIQLRILFKMQVLQTICKMFESPSGKFDFEECTELATINAEMTGFSFPIEHISLLGLRILKDWNHLDHKLPSPEIGVQKLPAGSRYKLDTLEKLILEHANGFESIRDISQQLKIPVLKTQQIVFRLSVVGLVEETLLEAPLIMIAEGDTDMTPEPNRAESTKPKVSQSFLNNLVGFLRK